MNKKFPLTLFEQNSMYSDKDVFSTGNNKNILLYMSLIRFDRMVSISVLMYSESFSFISCYDKKKTTLNNVLQFVINHHNLTSIFN